MRLLLQGLLILILSSIAFGQAEGEIESIGYDGFYRPDTWVPMKLRLRAKTSKTETYQLVVLQEDLDKDRVLYSRPVVLTGNTSERAVDQEFWCYFLPQAKDIDKSAGNARELSDVIKVFLCTPSGKQLVQIPVLPSTRKPSNLDQLPASTSMQRRLVLMVSGGDGAGGYSSSPIKNAYSNAVGMNEDVEFVPVDPRGLPTDVRGYQCVDTIIWLNSDPTRAPGDVMRAIEEYVRDGGQLVVTPGAGWNVLASSSLAPLLPVTLDGEHKEFGLRTMRRLAGLLPPGRPASDPTWKLHDDPFWLARSRSVAGRTITFDPWFTRTSPLRPEDAYYTLVRSTAKPDALVQLSVMGHPQWPFLARGSWGLGSVVWIAQAIDDPNIVEGRLRNGHIGWSAIYDQLLGAQNRTISADMAQPEDTLGYSSPSWKLFLDPYAGIGNQPDIGVAMLDRMEAGKRGAAYVLLAVVFFIGYWLISGPGSYFFLLSRKKSTFSWVAFALCAIVATGLTMVIVKLVLRGPPELHHVTFVRAASGEDAVAMSQFGLYIPRDGAQRIELGDTNPKRTSWITPYPAHPDQNQQSGSEFPAFMEYEIPAQGNGEALAEQGERLAPSRVDVPYRSTLKKIQARWVGKLPGAIDGQVSLGPREAGLALSGKLVNNTAYSFGRIYLVYSPYPFTASERARRSAADDDVLVTLESGPGGGEVLPPGQSIDLAAAWPALQAYTGNPDDKAIANRQGWRGLLGTYVDKQWREELHRNQGAYGYGDFDRALLWMSIYSRVPPFKNTPVNTGFQMNDRVQMVRRGARQFDASAAVASGRLLVIARTGDHEALPFPLQVAGEKVAGDGVTVFQFVLPLGRSGPATRPRPDFYTDEPPMIGEPGTTTAPATRPAAVLGR